MAKPAGTTDDMQWALNNVTDTVSGQANKAAQSATMKSNGWSSDQYPPMNWFNYWMNKVYLWIKGIDSYKARTDTYVIASSNSMTNSQDGSDLVINIGSDAGAAISAAILTISNAGGGRIKLMEGVYNLTTAIVMQNNVYLTGCGDATIIRRNTASLGDMITIASGVIGYSIYDLDLDGNGSNFTPVNSKGNSLC